MASTALSNFLSFFAPSKPPPPPPPKAQLPHLSFPSDSKNRDGLAPLVAANDGHNPLSSVPDDVISVVCPSLSHANMFFFRSAYNVQVIVDENEPEEKLLGRFRREVMRAGVIQECKRRRFFENKQDEKKRKSREAAKRNRRRRPQSRNSFQDKQEASKGKREEEDAEDNWELPEGDLPY
ncbi:30S ribosomal protein S21, chloroplastic [Diospyros lotus]|uniref:30S ribosomal protein S21, chloroplastic n=1 Tax=Diospyros lotus TaxID=55363 RepID=UPI0022585813|nr:30S ribosomal protein S21, chloroplastic [Diospyros lotus]